jgi:NTE family protein
LALASCLLFESSDTCDLVRLVERDTQARKAGVLAFFED